jgi:hypothetical protein
MEKFAPAKFQVIWTLFGSLKVKNIKKEVFWFSQVNDKIREHVNYSQ